MSFILSLVFGLLIELGRCSCLFYFAYTKGFNMEEKEVYIVKESGEKELFDITKLQNSLENSGVPTKLTNDLIKKILAAPPFKSTKEIYDFVHTFLYQHHRGAAGRYNLKRAIMELGPSGFPFEKFMGEVFREQGFSVQLNVVAKGKCVSHELDAVVTKGQDHFMVECKYHNRTGLKTNVRVPLYIKARFDDIKAKWETSAKHPNDFHQAWIATNTKFTSNAITYAKCVNIKLIGWAYPKERNLGQLIDNLHLHPITTLSTLTKQQKEDFLKNGLVLCRNVRENKNMLVKMNISDEQISKIIEESEAICELKK